MTKQAYKILFISSLKQAYKVGKIYIFNYHFTDEQSEAH